MFLDEVSLNMLKVLGTTILFLGTVTYFSAGANVRAITWLESSNCTELSIYRYKSISDDKRIAEVTIKNKEAIQELSERIYSLLKNSDKMTKLNPKDERTDLIFQCEDKEPQTIKIISKRFEVTSTHFLKTAKNDEKNLVRDIESLLNPGLNKRILKIKDHLVKFKDFSIKYITSVHMPQDPNGPSIGPTNNVQFEIFKNDSSNKFNVIIFDRQTPPQPEKFVIGKKNYYLLTYQNLIGERLYPKYFEISDQIPKR